MRENEMVLGEEARKMDVRKRERRHNVKSDMPLFIPKVP